MRWELDWIANRARLLPDSIAVVDGEEGCRFTYKEMNERAENLANYLSSIGIQKGDRIALLSPNHVSYFDLLFACGKIGAIFVPINWRLSQAEIEYILQNCTPKLLVVSKKLEKLVLNQRKTKVINIDLEKYHNITANNSPERKHKINISENDPLAIIYTGGTTGKPKGVVLSHEAILWNGINTIISWNLTASDTTLTYLPMFHTGGLNALSIPILMMGGKVVIGRDFESEKAIQLMNQERCTIVLMVPTMYLTIINSECFNNTSFPTMHTFLSGGAPCPLEIYHAFEQKGLSFKEGYGLTEAGPNNFFIEPTMSKLKRGSVGKPCVFNEVKIMTTNGTEADVGEVGELLIRGKHVFTHYWDNPQATAEVYKDGWLYTGDLGKRDEEGFHYIVSRKKEMIITGGENVYPLEVEHCIQRHPAVNEVAVIGLPHEKWGEMVVAVVSLKKDKYVTDVDLTDFCKQILGKYKIPKHFIFADNIPKTHVGKIDKNKLKNTYECID
ncbi:long-chain fatty acid--CoA ligase [Cytobacillus depressus]|uniref:Long-chain fatty acid--CoA ligase n=1 Tax=Cytobacillus depressus TaxID=1602942 RepID=A0A6L3V5I5_9BACI|nr:long-chain fatty acid--CoA ligase [Cytobacillus depressus]KAB2336333.1 long-chain fatty acid--CoA ligase [Cytobacillus depressus]